MREELFRRYEFLQRIMMRHFEAALGYTAAPTLIEIARRLGLADGRFLLADAGGESLLLSDLGIYTAKEGRSRAIDRYARKARPRGGTDEALVLDTMRGARFSLWRVERPQERAGVVVADLLRGTEMWLPDPDFEGDSAGVTFAARVGKAGGFGLACGPTIPVDGDMLEAVAADPLAFRHAEPALVADDPRFATAVYRAAIDLGVIDLIAASGNDASDHASLADAEIAEAAA